MTIAVGAGIITLKPTFINIKLREVQVLNLQLNF